MLLYRMLASGRYMKRLNALAYFTGMIDAVWKSIPMHAREREVHRLMACHASKAKSKYLPHQGKREMARRSARLALQHTEG